MSARGVGQGEITAAAAAANDKKPARLLRHNAYMFILF
jgi:hypothetical protein